MSYIYRHRTKDGFVYKNHKPNDLERINKLKIPPVWKDVKIDKNPNSNIQATGIDSKGRKQYIYNKEFVEKSKANKFKKLDKFDYSKYSRVIKNDILKKDLSRNCIIANIIKLMEDLNIRVGNESYKKENGSYGITTLLKKHLKGNKLEFVGKKGINHIKYITNPVSIEFIKRVNKLKGPNLFYFDNGSTVYSNDLNNYLKEKVQNNVTCKDIRTYCANKIFLNYMNKLKLSKNEKDRKKQLNEGIDHTANELGNTRKICKESYLCPKNLNKFI
tara:strand:+ start:3734 stop:4555 length:822 start_codon:yes stop_codon:yes gene_type:complete